MALGYKTQKLKKKRSFWDRKKNKTGFRFGMGILFGMAKLVSHIAEEPRPFWDCKVPERLHTSSGQGMQNEKVDCARVGPQVLLGFWYRKSGKEIGRCYPEPPNM